jgi:predicted hydrocarbon binding protein
MEPITKSGYFISNRYARILLKGYEEVLGMEQLQSVLSHAHLEAWLAAYPPDNQERAIDFVDCSAVNLALEELYGSRGGCGLAIRAGRAAFNDLLTEFGSQLGFDKMSFKLLPMREKIRTGLQGLADLVCQISDQVATVTEQEASFLFTVQRCPVCWGRNLAGNPICCLTTGILQESLRWLSGGQDWCIAETRCIAKGDPVCEFEIPKTAL